MKRIQSIFFLLSLLAITFISCSKDTPSEPEEEPTFAEKLQIAIEDELNTYGGKGISVAIIIPGEEIWTGVSGVSHGTTPITKEMLFAIGSTTKNFTAALILQLEEEGMLTLEDSLHKWLPVYPHIDSTITIRQLLNHTNGIFNFTDHPTVWNSILSNSSKFWTHEEVITNFVLDPYFQPGADWHYSNTGYVLLGMIIEEVTGSSLSAEFRNRFWTPLGMSNTYLAAEESIPEPITHGWFDLDGDDIYDDLSSLPMTAFYSAASTAGAVFSSAGDLAEWSHALFQERSILTQTSLDQMLMFYTPIPSQPLLAGYGLGVIRYTPELFNGLEVWGHSGDAPGYAAGSLFLPDYGVCIGIMDNTEKGDAMPVINDLLSIITSHLEETP